MKTSKKILLIFILIFLLIGSFCLAQKRLEVEYPRLPGVQAPVTTKTALPDYLRYVFTFAIMIAGLFAFGALIYGGILYLTSAGDPSKIQSGRDQIMAGFLGLIIILSSFLILNTINPQLVILGKPPIEPGTAGIRIYTLANCQETEEDPSFPVNVSLRNLSDIETHPEMPDIIINPPFPWLNGKKIHSIKFLGKPSELTVTFWEHKDYKGRSVSIKYETGDPQPCKPVPAATYRSISLDWRIPGVYLYASDNCEGREHVVYQLSSATLPEFNDRTRSIKFVYGDFDKEINKYQRRFAAILHERENYMGEAKLYDQDHERCERVTGISVSSITVYEKPRFKPDGTEEIVGNGVRFYEDKNYTGCVLPETGFYKDGAKVANLFEIKKCGSYEEEGKIKCKRKDDCDNTITSVDIDGRFVALLFDLPGYRGECEVFMSRDPDLRNNRMGQCGWHGRGDCLTSFIIKARK